MEGKSFTHLHVHSEYSLLDGAAGIDKLVAQAGRLGMDSLALTDHGNMFGAVAFYQAGIKAGVKPIIGMEAYIAPGARTERDAKGIGEASYHLLLLAKDIQGYKNLLKLASIGYLEGFYYRPRIDRDVLEQFNEGLICASACLGGELPTFLLSGQEEKARETAEFYARVFGPERFFVEIQSHCAEQNAANPMLADLAAKMGLGLVATNDVHFLTADDYRAHEVLTCISTGKTLDDDKRMKYPPQLYLKSSEEMAGLFPDWPEAVSNTRLIAEQCNLELNFSQRHAPTFQPPGGKTAEKYLEELCLQGVKKRYGKMTPPIKERLYHELNVIRDKGFSGYFLIVWDFMHFARKQGIPCGTRGSGVGTMVGYVLDISNVNPLRYGLLFERFMDPERSEMPDIDVDICQNGRADVINYVREKYGHVAQIITFGTMKARAVIRDVARVMNVPLAEADKLAKLVPETLNITLDEAMDQEPKLQEWYAADQKIRDVIDIGRRLEGLARHASVHAAGVVIADEPLDNFLPLYKQTDSDDVITQYDGPTVEKVGLLKMDFLGLRTLTTIERARQLAKLGKGVDIDPNAIDLSDQNVLELFRQGRTKGMFQFESGGMQDLLMKMKPDRIEDLIAANALYRPGPMQLIGDYNARKHGQKWSLPHSIMEEVLAETYGIMVYQEQVMQMLNRLGNLPLARAYKLIKAISKKKFEIIQAEREHFIAGSVANGLEPRQAEEIFALIEKFGGYGFNKSHSTQYAILAFQTAFFKTYYPTEFMAALLTFEMASTEKVAEYIDECRQLGIKVLPPDVNESFTDFTVIYNTEQKQRQQNGERTAPNTYDAAHPRQDECIRFGLAAVKGVGEKAVQELIRIREKQGRFESLFDLCQRIDTRAINKGALEALIKAGAMDSLGGHRGQLAAALEDAMAAANSVQRDRRQGQLSFFDAFESDEEVKVDAAKLPDVPPWPESQLLQYEKDVLGMYVTSHPLAHFAEQIHFYSTCHTHTIGKLPAGTEVIIGGIFSRIRFCVTKNGRGAGARMAMFTLEDLNGAVEGVIFPDTLGQYEYLVQPDQMVFLRGTVDFRREDPSIKVTAVYDMNCAEEFLTHAVYVRLDEGQTTPENLQHLHSLCRSRPGKCPVYVEVITGNNMRVIVQTDNGVRPQADFLRRLEALVGHDHYRLLRPHDRIAQTDAAAI